MVGKKTLCPPYAGSTVIVNTRHLQSLVYVKTTPKININFMKPPMTTQSKPKHPNRRWAYALLASAWCLAACQAKDVPQTLNVPTPVAQSSTAAANVSTVAPLTDSQVKALYQNCPSGYYSGPRPGKTWVTKDNFIWAVTPAFAARFCMPPEFISTELKGAQAVAFQLLRDNSEMNCGFGGNSAACSGKVDLRFEIYIDSAVKLPRRHEGRYYSNPKMPSLKLISGTPKEHAFLKNQAKTKPESALTFHFDPQQIGLSGVKNGVIAWPITSLIEEIYFGGIFEGIDYYAFEGMSGQLNREEKKMNHIRHLAIVFKKSDRNLNKQLTGQTFSDMEHVIEMSESFSERIIELDNTRGRNVKQMLNEAFKVNKQ
jgi:hypothetical protein